MDTPCIKRILILLICLAGTQLANAQTLSLFDVDASTFPTMKAKFYAFNSAWQQQRPSTGELTLTENGIARTITGVSCSLQARPTSISSVLVIDVSGSMSNSSGPTSNMNLAKAAARAWVNDLPLGNSECAITSFDGSNYLNQDFTTDRAKLLNAIAPLAPGGGTDYDAGLIKPMAGGLLVSRNGKSQKVIVFLTDGQGTADESAIIAEANRQNCVIYCVTLGITAPIILKNIASGTRGQTFENVTTIEAAEEVYRKILHIAQRGTPCDITWTSDVACQEGEVSVSLAWLTNASTSSYQPPVGSSASLSVTPNVVAFGKRPPLTQTETTLTLMATNANFTVTGISRTFGSADFSVVNTTFPFSVPRGASRTITLRFMPGDSAVKYASFEIATDKCLASFSANGGFPGKRTTASTLKLTHPNGGETFSVGSDTVITWDGIAPSDTVTLEYSHNNGATWKRLTDQATGLKYSWKNVPGPTSAQCLVRVKQGGRDAGANAAIDSNVALTLAGHTQIVRGVAFSPDGRNIATAAYDKTVSVWDANSGAHMRMLTVHDNGVTGIAYSPDGSSIATASFDKNAKVWDSSRDTLIHTLAGHSQTVWSVSYNHDGSNIATAGADAVAKVWDANTGALVYALTGHTDGVWDVAFSHDGSTIATAGGDNTVKIWEANGGMLIRTLTGHTAPVRSVAFSPDGSKMATASEDNTAKVWDSRTGALIRSLRGHTNWVFGIAFSPDGSRVATAGGDQTAKVWDANTGSLLQTLIGHTGLVLNVAYSPDGSRIATAGYDRTAKVWDVGGSPIQEDVSDAVFSVVAPRPASQDVDMQQVLVGSVRDSLVSSFVQNGGTYQFRVDSIHVIGTDASQFQLVSGIPPFVVPASAARAVEFRFRPSSVGVKTAQLLVFTQADTLRQTIRGEGIAPALAVVNSLIDFGTMLVGEMKDTLRAVTITNVGNAPLTITMTRHAGPNDADFTTLFGGGSFTLARGDTARLDLRFTAANLGRTSGRLLFDYNGVGSPATVQLFAEGTLNTNDTARAIVVVQDITAQAGEKVSLILKLQNQTGLQLAGAPTNWYARIHYNKTILFNEQTNNVCTGTDDSCSLELTGKYNAATGELISIPCIATLGNTDNATIAIDEFRWTNSGIVTVMQTQNGSIRIAGICEEGGVRLIIIGKNSTSLTTRPNPAKGTLEIHYGLREPLTITLELRNITGQAVQTIVNGEQRASGQHTINADVSQLPDGIYHLRLITGVETLTTRVDVVK